MKSLMKLTAALCLLSIVSISSAFAQADDNMIEIGAGTSVTGDGQMEALIQVKGNLINQYSKNGYFIIVKVNADGSFNTSNFNYVDMEMRALGIGGTGSDELGVLSGFIEGSLLNIKYQRNLALGLDNMLTLNLIGVRLGGSIKINENVQIMAEAAMDLASVALSSKRSTDLMSMTKSGKNTGDHFKAELAVVLLKKIKIAVGVAAQSVYANGYVYETGTQTCTDVSDGYWSTDWDGNDYWVSTGSYRECTDDTAVNYQEKWNAKSTYIAVMANLTKNLSLFAKATYSVFEVQDTTGLIPGSKTAGWRFMFGVSYKIGAKK